MRGSFPSAIAVGNSSKESLLHKEKDPEEIAPFKPPQIIDVKQANLLLHQMMLKRKQTGLKVPSPGKKQGVGRRTRFVANEDNPKSPLNLFQNSTEFRTFRGKEYRYNNAMESLGDNFAIFPWENYNLDDFLSFMDSHKKTIGNYLDFYKDHCHHSDFLRSSKNENQTKVSVLSEHQSAVLQVIVNYTGTLIVSASMDKTIRLWDFEERKILAVYEGHDEPVTCVAITKDEKLIISGSRDCSLRIWEVKTKPCEEIQFTENVWPDAHSDWLNALILAKDDTIVITAADDKLVKIWNFYDMKEPLMVLKGHEDGVLSLALTPDEDLLFSGANDTEIRVWKMGTYTEHEVSPLKGHYEGVTTMTVSPDKSFLISGCEKGEIQIWNLSDFEIKYTISPNSSHVHSLYTTKNGKYIVAGFNDKTIKVFDLKSGQEKQEIEGHTDAVNSVTGSLNDGEVISASDDKTIRITRLEINEDGQVLYCHHEKVNCLVICPSGESIITSGGAKIKVYSLLNERPQMICEIGDNSHVEALTITLEGDYFISGNQKGEINVYTLTDFNLVRTFTGHRDTIYALKFSTDGKTIYSGSGDHLIGIWERDSHEKNKWRFLAGHDGEVRCLAVGKDQKLLYSGGIDKTIMVWDTVKSICLHSLKSHASTVYSLAISYEKRRLFSASADQTIRTWNLDTHTEVKEKTMYGHTDEVLDLVLSKDSKFLYSGSKDKTIRVWHVDLGRVEKIIEGHEGDVKGVRITPDKLTILSASYDRTVRKWNNEVREQEELILEGHENVVNKSCLNISNKRLISCSVDFKIKVWDFEKATVSELRTLGSHTDAVNWITQSRQDENILYSVGEDGYLKVWNIETGEELQSIKQPFAIRALTLSNNNNYLFIGLNDASIHQFSIKNALLTFQKTFPQQHTKKINQLNVTKNDARLVSAADDGFLIVWGVSGASFEKKLVGHQSPVLSVTSTNKVKNIISGGEDSMIRIWDVENGQEKMLIKGHRKTVFALLLTPDDKRLISGSEDNTVRIWRVKTGEQLNIILGHLGAVKNICLDKEAKRLITTSSDKTIRIQELPDSEKELVLRGHTNEVKCVVLSGDNTKIYTGSSDKSIKRWDFETGIQEKKFAQHQDAVLCLYLSTDDDNKLFSGSADKTIIQWDISTEQVLQTYQGHRSAVFAICLDWDEKHLISGSEDRCLRIWRVDDSDNVRELEGHKFAITCICMSLDGYSVFSGSKDKSIRQWNIETGITEHIFQDSNSQAIFSLCTYERGGESYLVSGGEDHLVRVWNVELGCVEMIFEGHKNQIFSVAVDCDSNYIVSTGKDRTIRIWNIENGQETHVYYGHSNSIFGLSLTSDGRQIVSVSKDQTIRLWRFQRTARFLDIEGNDCGVFDLCMTPDNRFLISASEDTTIRVWNMENFSEERVLRGHTKSVRSLQLLVNKRGQSILFSGSSDHTIRVWNWAAGEKNEMKTLEKRHHGAVICLAIDPSGEYLASGSIDNSILIWNLKSLEDVDFGDKEALSFGVEKIREAKFLPVMKHQNTVNCLQFSSDGGFLASGSSDGQIYLWDMTKPGISRIWKILDSHSETVNDLCLTLDDSRLISAGKDKNIRVWNLLKGKEERVLSGHEGMIYTITLSMDEKHVISGAADCCIKIWDLETGFCEESLEEHEDLINSIKVCKDGKRIVSASEDETIKVWWAFDPNFSRIFRMIEMLDTHPDDHKVAKMYPKFKEHLFSDFIFPFHSSLLHYYTYRNDSLAIERILNILDLQENQRFVITTDIFDKTPIDIAFENGNKRILNALFNYAISKPPPMNGFPNFLSALQNSIQYNLLNLEKIFDSRLIPLKNCIPIQEERFKLPEESQMHSDTNTHTFNHYCIEKSELIDSALIVESETEITNRVEFFILDIPYIVDVERSELLWYLIEVDSSNSLFSSQALQALLHYKWKSYASFSYARDILIFLAFLIIITINSVFLFPNRTKNILDLERRDKFKNASIVFNIIMIIFTVYFIGSEIFKLVCFGKRLYFSTVWHIIDLITLSIISATITLDMISIAGTEFDLAWLKALLSINIFLLWIKFLSFARGYQQTAFMVRMIIQVIYDISLILKL